MQSELTAIRDQHREVWNRFSRGWHRWDSYNMKFLKPIGDAIINELKISETDKVLDVASGTGEPGLSIATLLRKGSVTAVDISEQMLEAAQEKALAKGLNNFETFVCDVSDLSLNHDSFNKLSCRMGFMFFPDMQLAAERMYQVLKKEGRISVSVWGSPENNPWISCILEIVNKHMPISSPLPDTLSMFRSSAPGLMRSIFEKTGFKDITEREITGKRTYFNFNYYWLMITEIAAPVAGVLSKADEATKKKIKEETEAKVTKYFTGEFLELPFCSLIVSAKK